MSQVWHGSKMVRDVSDHVLTPAVQHNDRTYFVNELVERIDGRLFIASRWIVNARKIWGIGHEVTRSTVCTMISILVDWFLLRYRLTSLRTCIRMDS